MEDSGIDSDQQKNGTDVPNGIGQKTRNTSLKNDKPKTNSNFVPAEIKATSSTTGANKNSTQIQKKIARQREAVRTSQTADPANRNKGLLSRNRLPVPSKVDAVISTADMQPLVMIETDESEDEFTMPGLSTAANREITQQLIKDGYNLDLEPDDEDLDLIPPRPLAERCVCCPGSHLWSASCTVQ